MSGSSHDLLVRVPKGRSLFALHAAVARAAGLWGVTLEPGRALRLPTGEPAVDLVCARAAEQVRIRMVQTAASGRPRIALVVDDFGYPPRDLVDRYLRLGFPFTPAILPGYPRSLESARRFVQAGHAPILHLPMDPKDQEHNDPGPGLIRSTMEPAEIRAIVTGHLADLEGIMGVSQHMGSRGSEEAEVVAPALDALAGRGLVFLDSATSPRSILPAEAARRGVRCVTADLFLDGDPHPSRATMAARMLQARSLAEEAGSAILICHARKGTLEYLESVSDSLAGWGCRFVSLGELLR
jgi:polysaccharide deacetylase 2 family uncharacterized protein YibQ